jgi:hypothetical protein
MSTINYKVFTNALKDKLGRELTRVEKESIFEYLSTIKITAHTSLKLAFKYYMEMVLRELKKNKPATTTAEVDLKAVQMQILSTGDTDNAPHQYADAYADSSESLAEVVESAKLEALFLLHVADVYNLSKAIAPKSKMKYNYLLLDSANCYDIPNSRDKFTWLIQEEHTAPRTGYINLHAKLRNIKMARLGRMSFSHMYADFTQAALDRDRFGFGFDEFTSQALITPDNNKFQFISFLPEYDTAYGTNVVLTSFNANRGWFRFRENFKMLDKLTLGITNLSTNTKFVLPTDPLQFPASFVPIVSGVRTDGAFVGGSGAINIPDHRILIPWLYQNVNIYTFAITNERFVISDFNNGNADDMAFLNGQQLALSWYTRNAEEIYSVNEGGFLFAGTPPPPDLPFNLTLLYAPRFTGVLELISEDDSDDETVG